MYRSIASIVFLLMLTVNANASQHIGGSAGADVQLLIYGDLQCPFTKAFLEYKPRFEADFGPKIGMVFAHFPIGFHDQAKPAAVAAQCAALQEKSAAFVDEIVKHQGTLGRQAYIDVASQVGVPDLSLFTKCLDAKAARELVEADAAGGIAAGVQGTPYVFVNGKLFQGVYPYEDFKAAIDEALNKN